MRLKLCAAALVAILLAAFAYSMPAWAGDRRVHPRSAHGTAVATAPVSAGGAAGMRRAWLKRCW
jgi:hypothetical protein